MKGKFANILLSYICLAGTFIASAGPLQTEDVPQNPSWVAHLDCDALRSNAIGKFLLAEMEKPENQTKLAAAMAIFGVDLRTQIHGLTFFAASGAPHQPVLLVHGDFDTNRLATIVKAAQEYDSTNHGAYVIHSWLDDKKKTRDGSHPRVYAALPTSSLIIFGPRRQAVADALDVLDKKAGSLTGNQTLSDLLKASDDSTFFQAAAPRLELPASDSRKAVFDLTTHVSLSVREGNDQLTAMLGIGARDEEVAKNMLSISQGITGLIRAQQEKPKLAKLAENVSFTQNGSELSATFSAQSDQVVEFLKVLAAHKGKH
jgi:hypothetical protein